MSRAGWLSPHATASLWYSDVLLLNVLGCGETGQKRERALAGTGARSKVAEDNPRYDKPSLLCWFEFPVLGRFTGISQKNRALLHDC
jgi:hypothetical protein